MDRRAFLRLSGWLATGLAVGAIAPSELLASSKSYFLPPVGGWTPARLAFHQDAFFFAMEDITAAEYGMLFNPGRAVADLYLAPPLDFGVQLDWATVPQLPVSDVALRATARAWAHSLDRQAIEMIYTTGRRVKG